MQVFAVCVAFHPLPSRVIKIFFDKNKAASFAAEQCNLAERVYAKTHLEINSEIAKRDGFYLCWANDKDIVWVCEVPYDDTSSVESTRDYRDGYG